MRRIVLGAIVALLVTIVALIALDKPARAATGSIIIVNTATSGVYASEIRSGLTAMDNKITLYRFSYARSCTPNPGAHRKCLFIGKASLDRRYGAVTTIRTAHDSTVRMNSAVAGNYTSTQRLRMVLHELGHAFGLYVHSTSPSNIMYYRVVAHSQSQTWNSAQTRHFNTYRT